MIPIITIPDYLVKTLDAKGITINVLEDKISSLVLNIDKNRELYNSSCESFFKFMKDNVSEHDITDLLAANQLVDEILYGTSYEFTGTSGLHTLTEFALSSISYSFNKNTYQDNYANFINHMSSKIKDLNSIILNNGINEVAEFKPTQRVLFIVIKSGFTNVKRFKNNDFVSYFRKQALNSLFNTYGEKVLKDSVLFKRYIGLSGNL